MSHREACFLQPPSAGHGKRPLVVHGPQNDGRVVEDRLEQRLRRPERLLCSTALGDVAGDGLEATIGKAGRAPPQRPPPPPPSTQPTVAAGRAPPPPGGRTAPPLEPTPSH